MLPFVEVILLFVKNPPAPESVLPVPAAILFVAMILPPLEKDAAITTP
jgi:hypothetical protein